MATVTWDSDADLSVRGTRFHCAFPDPDGPDDVLSILKTRAMVEPYVDLVDALQPRRVLELGIHRGGSAAFLYELARPEVLVAVELQAEPAPLLSRFVAERGLGGVLRTHYGVDQGDRPRLGAILDQDLDGHPLDLVVDDASHLYAPTLASFEVVFPRLRPGGRYVIEDWTSYCLELNDMAASLAALPGFEEAMAERVHAGMVPDPDPLVSLLTVELVLARASDRDVVADVHVDRYWTVVTRGEEPIDPATFRLADLYHDHMRLLERVRPR